MRLFQNFSFWNKLEFKEIYRQAEGQAKRRAKAGKS
jgi:hypothetical protein